VYGVIPSALRMWLQYSSFRFLPRNDNLDLQRSPFVMQTCAFLHVEDSDADAFLFRAALDQAGIKVSVYRVSDGEQALAFLHRSGTYTNARRPELLVLDLNMPRMDGWTVLSWIRKDAELESIPAVVLSTSSGPEDRCRALALGARRYVVKPTIFNGWVHEVELICSQFLNLSAVAQSE
jgi:chemotaxis family two-component system response regulator Rcp1